MIPSFITRTLLTINLSIAACASLWAQGSLQNHYLRTEYQNNPFIDIQSPRLSWELHSDERDQVQSAWQVLVATSPDLLHREEGDLWDSGKQTGWQTSHIVYQGKKLQSRQKAYWKVRSWDKQDQPGEWSENASWEIALLPPEEWKADWIGYDLTHKGQGEKYHLPPVPYLRKEIQLSKPVARARLYITSLGLHSFSINGSKVGNEWLAPGWTNYDKRLHYRAWDVTGQLREGGNALGIALSYGWYAGYTGYAILVKLPKVKNFYGEVPKALAQLEVVYEDGSSETFTTDGSWKAEESPIQESDLLNGERYDARMEMPGWDRCGFDDKNWKPVQVFEAPACRLLVHPSAPVVTIAELPAKSITARDNGKFIFDLGQNFAGVVRLKVKGEKGQLITLRFGEMLHPDGRLMTENLREARCIDTYICRGDPQGEIWTPQFTQHGFQFVEVSGLTGTPALDTITGIAMSSDTPMAGSFNCGKPMLNQLYSNIVWTQRANFIDIPTDCPQRDERLGWTGDAQIYISSAILNSDVASFFTKWMRDLNDEQWDFGAFPNFAPRPFYRTGLVYSPGWMEAGVICPYHIYQAYGDTRIIEECWPHMERFMTFHWHKSGGKGFYPETSFEDIHPLGGFADWLSLGKKTPPDLLASFYYGYCAKLMAEMAGAIGNNERKAHYEKLFEKIVTATKKHYMNADGSFRCNEAAYGDGKGYVDGKLGFSGHTQTAYANAIYMGFVSGEEMVTAGKHLCALIEANGGKLSTGFLGVKALLPSLSLSGFSQTAFDLILQREYPSWGFEVDQGATSIWERWNSYTKEHGFVEGMNSFSHYSFGSVYEWMISNMAGIQNAGEAFRKIRIAPETDPRIGHVAASYHSIRGKISSNWKYTDRGIEFSFEIPVNCEASVVLPEPDLQKIYENGKSLGSQPGKYQTESEKTATTIRLGSGRYEFRLTQ